MVPSKRSFKREHRNIHQSQYGIIAANSTTEYVDVGLTTFHTLTPVITNRYGSYGVKNIDAISGWNTLGLDEALTPFQNQVDSDRLTLARTHANQVTPISGAEPPLIATGAEFITTQLASPRFIHRAKKDGTVIEVDPNKTMTIKYKDGTTEVLDIIPRLSRTKRGIYISLELKTLEVGEKFVANQPVAFTNNFNENGSYCAGRNVFMAVMNYNGYSHEDSYVISDMLAQSTKTDTIVEVDLMILPDMKIIKLEQEKNKHVNNGDVLVEFTYENSLEDYLETTQLESSDDENVSNMFSTGTETIKKLAPEGEIVDIKVYINNKNSVDKQLLNFHSSLVKNQLNIINKLQSTIKDPLKKIQATDNVDLSFINFGNHKYKGNLFNGARIVYYIKRQKDLKVGDKISNRYGNKGVISKILTQPARGEITPNIDVFLSPIGVFSRKNVSLLKELYLGKIFHFANIKLQEMANDTKITIDEIGKFITDIYSILGLTKLVESAEQTLKQYNTTQLRSIIKSGKLSLICIVEPFQDIKYESIKSAADFLDIPLNEKVYIPEFDQWTDVAVPVGVSYFTFLEHYSDVYANIRGTGKFVGLTRQPTKRKSQGGGQSIARLDIYSFLTYDAKNILSELLGPRSDEHRSKRDLYNNIIDTGELQDIPEVTKSGGTRDIFNLYITGLGLEID